MIQANVNLKPYNTFGLACTTKSFARFNDVNTLIDLLKYRKENNEPLLVLGGGSNILLTQDFDGLVLKNELKGIEQIDEDTEHIYVKSGAGEVWHDLVMHALELDLGGIENLSLIPGSVGAAPMQNIGAYGVEIKDVFHELEALNIETLEIETFNNEECQFGYRESVFKRDLKGDYIILNITLKLDKHHQINTQYGAIETELGLMNIAHPGIKDVSQAVINIRKRKLPDPKEIGNSGSFFKNPVVDRETFERLKLQYPNIAHYPISEDEIKLAAGWLIDQAGWKGKTFDDYGVHKNQALVLVNYGNAKGIDIYNLSEEILQNVHDTYGITLEREVNIIN